MTEDYQVWKREDVTRDYLEGKRAAIPFAAEQIDIMLQIIKAAHTEVVNFLDVGCGDGVLGRALLSQFPDVHGVLLDFSKPMLDRAQQKLGQKPNITYMQQDYSQANWSRRLTEHAPFTVIVSGFSIHHQPDRTKFDIYEQIYDLLAPGGVFLNLEHVSPPSAWVETLFEEAFIDSMVAHERQTGGDKSRDQLAEEFHNRPDKVANILAPVEVQCNWLREIGFEHVDCYFKVYELALFGGLRPL